MLSIQLHMPDIGLLVMNNAWQNAQPLYWEDLPTLCTFGDLLDKVHEANQKHGVISGNTPSFLRNETLNCNQIAHLLRYAISTWKLRHKQINQRMITWATDAFSDFLPRLKEADKTATIDLITLKKGESFKNQTLQRRALYELEKAQKKLRQHQGDDPVQFICLVVREVDEAMQRAQSNGGISLGQLFRRQNHT